VEKLPPGVKDYWKKTSGVDAPSEGSHKEEMDED
jgi:hypothetical protein